MSFWSRRFYPGSAGCAGNWVGFRAAGHCHSARWRVNWGWTRDSSKAISIERTLIADRFDWVFVSCRALIWLPDIAEWARVVAHFTKPGGRFSLAEGHPAAAIFDDEQPREPSVAYYYFVSEVPSPFDRAESSVS